MRKIKMLAIKSLIEQKIKEMQIKNTTYTSAIINNKKDLAHDKIIYGQKANIPERLK